MRIEEVKISEIRYQPRRRIRKELGNLTPLKESIQKYGLFYPVILTPDYELIAGQRRLEAVRQLGWTSVEALILHPVSKLDRFEMEVEENLVRKEFTLDEMELILEKRRRLSQKGFLKKIAYYLRLFWRWLKLIFGR